MLKAVGIIAEYNPFHNGHRYQLQQARHLSGADVVIVVMSGNYVQRGEPALLDKWTRSAAAIENGADLVMELPLNTAVQPADRFARGGIYALAGLNCAAVAFGTEQPDLNYAQLGQQINDLPAEPAAFIDYSQTYATQLNAVYQERLHVRLDDPNVILALGYAAANARLMNPMTLVPVPRVAVGHDEPGAVGHFASASALRQMWTSDFASAYVPTSAWQLYQDAPVVRWEDLWPYLHYRLLTMTPVQLREIYQMTEGLEYRFIQQNRDAASFSDLLQRVKTKRFTYSRLSRVALYTLLACTNQEMNNTQGPLRVLGFSPIGQRYLKQIRSQEESTVITNVNAKNGADTAPYGLTIRADRVYTLVNGHSQNFGRAPFQYRKDE
ncbi:MAG: nucleotidyltransferase [Schleiferilactobacillus harbinensis]|jgi:predicted nucleotidyltransferase|nr:nucleotidyltransferase [Schleiferilactobacillus harbinensis]MCI1913581.1 nucleotidyltransferase [Schleiferilactobacillus harbinensis]